MVSVYIGIIAIASGLTIGLCALAAGMAEKQIGAAVISVMTEKPELFSKGLILTVVPETIVIFGLVVAILTMNAF
jgi:V/A-type H+/Na+-transporting ATPase subunit K